LFFRGGIVSLALFSWFAALLPAEPLIQWARMNRSAVLAAIVVAILARIDQRIAISLWRPLAASTFWGVDCSCGYLDRPPSSIRLPPE